MNSILASHLIILLSPLPESWDYRLHQHAQLIQYYVEQCIGMFLGRQLTLTLS
jgi:hypothetical protein